MAFPKTKLKLEDAIAKRLTREGKLYRDEGDRRDVASQVAERYKPDRQRRPWRVIPWTDQTSAPGTEGVVFAVVRGEREDLRQDARGDRISVRRGQRDPSWVYEHHEWARADAVRLALNELEARVKLADVGRAFVWVLVSGVYFLGLIVAKGLIEAFIVLAPGFVMTRSHQLVLVAAVLVIGWLVFRFRSAWRYQYGLAEVGFAAFVSYQVFTSVPTGALDTSAVVALVGAVFLVVRGLDNCHEATKWARFNRNAMQLGMP